ASANYLGYLVGALMAAGMPWPATVQLRAGRGLVIVTTAAMGITDSWGSWLAWRFLAGVASAWVVVSTWSLCRTRLAGRGQSRRGGVVFAGVGSGIALAGLLCMALTVAAASSSYAWLVLSVAALLGTWLARSLWISPAAPQNAAV